MLLLAIIHQTMIKIKKVTNKLREDNPKEVKVIRMRQEAEKVQSLD